MAVITASASWASGRTIPGKTEGAGVQREKVGSGRVAKKAQLIGRCGKGNGILLKWRYEMLPLQLESDG